MKLITLNDKSPVELESILKGCKYTEKLDTHYVKVKILNSKKIVCCKASGKPITSEDKIFNKMWSDFVEDWVLILNLPEFQNILKNSLIGCTIGMFYFPCKTPLSTTYKFSGKRHYAFHQLYDAYNKEELQLNNESFKTLINIVNLSDLNQRFTISMNLYNDMSETVKDNIIKHNSYWRTQIKTLASDMSDIELVIKDNKNNYYQLLRGYKKADAPCNTERTSYEFVLCDFIKFVKSSAILERLRAATYKQIVCQCFNEYIDIWERNRQYIQTNVDIAALAPPHIGFKHPDNINHTYIHNRRTLELCAESELYRNIFKILLANLKSKKQKKYCVYMNDNQINDMNNIVKTINHLKTVESYDND